MEVTKLISIVSMIMATIVFIGIYVIYRIRKKKKAMNIIEKRKIIRGFLIEDNCVVLHGSDENIEALYDDDFEFDDQVYIHYYAEYKAMLLLAYIKDLGFVLKHNEDDARPKFYFLHEVFIGVPRDTYVEGYMHEEENVFMITKKH